MLAKQHRLLRDADFQKIWKQGKSFYTKSLGFKLLKNNLTVSRFGIVIGTKISKKSTIRNKIKRQLSEIIRLKLKEIALGYDLIIIALPSVIGKDYQELEKEIQSALKHFNILRL